jgi:hypothetical protein
MSSSSLTFRALAALPLPLQTLARQHVQQHPRDCLDDLISELALAALEFADRATDASSIYNRARSRLRRQTQDVAHFSAPLDDEHQDIERDNEPTPTRRADIVREVQQRQRVTARRAQQLVKQQLARAAMGDLFIGDESGVAA